MNATVYVVAEVMDKEPTLGVLWITAIVICVVGFALVRYRRILLIVPYLLATCFALVVVPEIRDPFVGPAIHAEAGARYIVQAYIAVTLAFIVPTAALLRLAKGALSPNSR